MNVVKCLFFAIEKGNHRGIGIQALKMWQPGGWERVKQGYQSVSKEWAPGLVFCIHSGPFMTAGNWHLQVAEKLVDLCHSARRNRWGLSRAAGNSAPPLGLLASRRRVSLDWLPPWECPSSPGCSANKAAQAMSSRTKETIDAWYIKKAISCAWL